MGTIVAELNSTWTAQWYRTASGTQRADAWAERLRYFRALSDLLADLVTGSGPAPPGPPPHRQQIAPRALITEVARRAQFAAHETLYKRFRSEWEGPIARWAGTDEAVKPRNALVAEAKIVSFWPYREAVLRLASQPGVALQEVAAAYLRALATWAGDDTPLAACRPAGPPACVAEDMRVLAALWLRRAIAARMIPAPRPGTRDRDPLADKAGQLEGLAREVVSLLLADRAMTADKAVDAMRDDVGQLLADPTDPVLDQLTQAATQLSDRLARRSPDDRPVTAVQARHLLALLAPLTTQLSQIGAELPIQNGPVQLVPCWPPVACVFCCRGDGQCDERDWLGRAARVAGGNSGTGDGGDRGRPGGHRPRSRRGADRGLVLGRQRGPGRPAGRRGLGERGQRGRLGAAGAG